MNHSIYFIHGDITQLLSYDECLVMSIQPYFSEISFIILRFGNITIELKSTDYWNLITDVNEYSADDMVSLKYIYRKLQQSTTSTFHVLSSIKGFLIKLKKKKNDSFQFLWSMDIRF